MTGIFVNYRQTRRRVGSEPTLYGHAQLVEAMAERLAHHFGSGLVFLDTTLRIASRYPDELRRRLDRSEVVIAVIHHGWLDDLDAGKTGRAAAEKDWVHDEIALALETGTTVVPLLLGSARMPLRDELPAELRELAMAQAHRIRFGHFAQDMERLIHALEQHVAPVAVELRTTVPRTRSWIGPTTTAVIFGPTPIVATVSLVDQPDDWWVWLAALEAVSLSYLLLIMGAGAALYLLRSLVDRVDRDIAEARPSDKHNVVIGLMITVPGMIFLATNDQLNPNYQLGLLAFLALFAISMVPKWLRDRETAHQWPKPSIEADVADIRAALAGLRRQLDACQAPLSRLQHDQASGALDQIRRATDELHELSLAGRGRWLRQTSRWFTLTHVAATASTIGAAAGATYGYLPSNGLAAALTAAGLVVACGLHLGTVELAYRRQRWRRRTVVEAARQQHDLLERRLLEASITPTAQPVGN